MSFNDINYLACLITSSLLLSIFIFRKYLFLKPSLIVIVLFHILIQWSAAVNSEYIKSYLPFHWDFFIIVHGFPLIGIYLSCFIVSNKQSKKIWERLLYIGQTIDSKQIKLQKKSLIILLILTVLITLVYLSYVPLSQTGLYSILTDPLNSSSAREESFKLINNKILRYAYSFMRESFGPLLVVLCTLQINLALSQKKILLAFYFSFILIMTSVVISLAGSRATLGEIILAIILANMLNNIRKINPLLVLIGFVLVTVPIVLLSLLREGRALTFENFWLMLSIGIFGRIFLTPLKTGIWYAHYAQTQGFWGIVGISKIASFLGLEGVNIPNYIGLNYMNVSIDSVSANTSFVFAYYSYFGLIGLLLCLIFLLCLDYGLIVVSQLSDGLLIPCISVLAINCLGFISSDYTTVLLTGGFLVTLLTVTILDKIVTNLRIK
ncbi:hypothetical protein [Crocosphaera sp.]|uniref:hypothetical protein n=1 Tax=Crocosphaera sp. TaxID=2729996 RepID=UPI00263312EB|nr:hypothetical protein [Crocosphaera sp.]MDJ0578517.1 hypothetical protein [Crocosphaera sp.]